MSSSLDRKPREALLVASARRVITTGLLAALSGLVIAAGQQRSAEGRADTAAGERVIDGAPSDTPQTREETAAKAPAVQDTGKAEQAGAAQAPAGSDVYDGWKMYAVTCERCHGQDALGSALAPDLRKSAGTLGHDGFVEVVLNGRTEKGMPGYQGVLEPQQIENIYAYVQARSSGQLGAGRPPQ